MERTEPTVSATEFSQLTGLSRERLRTWERRHGFPAPVRAGSGRRRYSLADVAPLIAARRATESGVPVGEALARAREPGTPGADAAALALGLDESPLQSVIVSGPRPVTVVYANRAAREGREAPDAGTELSGELATRLAAAFAARGASRFPRPPWREDGIAVPCLAVPLADGSAGSPLLALYDLDDPDTRAERAGAHATQSELERTRGDLAEREAALELADEVALALRDRSGVAAIVATTELLVRRLDIVDAAIAPYMTGQIVLGRSSRRLLGPDMVTVAAHPLLAQAIGGEITAMDPADAELIGAPGGLGALIVPAVCAGEPLGVLLLLFDDTPSVGPGLLRTLRLVGTTLGLALMQERLLSE